MNELDSNARQLLEAFQADQTPPAGARDRVWESMQARAAAGDLGPSVGGSATATAGIGTPSLLLGGVALAVGAGLVGWALTAGDPTERERVASPPPTVELAAPAAQAVVRPPPTPAEGKPAVIDLSSSSRPALDVAGVDTSSPEGSEPETAEPRPRVRRSKTKPLRPEPALPAASPEDDLAAELALMGKAREALRAGDYRRALSLLDRHAKQFRGGLLKGERETSQIRALCQLGERDAARELASRVAGRRGSSHASDRVMKICP